MHITKFSRPALQYDKLSFPGLHCNSNMTKIEFIFQASLLLLIVIHISGLHYNPKKQFHTTTGTYMTGVPCETRTNQGILQMNYKLARDKRSR